MRTKRITALFMAFMMLVTIGAGGIFEREAFADEEYADISGCESLAEIYSDYFRVGSACEAISNWNVKSREIGNPYKEAAISGLFNSITCGNEMKPSYNFDPNSPNLFKINPAADEMMKWAADNGVGMRGHVLVWHSQCNPGFFCKDFTAYANGRATKSESAWLDEDCLVDRETFIERMRSYIYAMIEYTYKNGYAGTIYAWDVVNEATDEGTLDGLRQSTWYRILGKDFLYYAFLFAREAETMYAKQYAADYGLDPEGDLSPIMPKLFYNDYNEWVSRRTDTIIRFLTKDVYNEGQSMVKSDVIRKDGDGTIFGDGLVDGIGMQGHLSDTQSIASYKKALEAYNEAVGEVQITELDVGCTRTDNDRFYVQAQFYYNFFSMLVEEVKNGVNLTSVTLWGLTDTSSWRADTEPLLFYGNLEAKPAYKAVAQAGKGEEFTVTLAESLTEIGDMTIDFEPYHNTAGELVTVDAREAGVLPRGSGHLAKVMLAAKMNHTPGQAVGFGAKVIRDDRDANVMIDISKYSGKTIDLTMYVMTEDSVITLGMDGAYPYILDKKYANGTGADGWIEFSHKLTVPGDMTAVYLFVETDGTKEIYLDDISVKITEPDGSEQVITREALDEGIGNDGGVSLEPADTVKDDGTQAAADSAQTPEADTQTADGSTQTSADNTQTTENSAPENQKADNAQTAENDGNKTGTEETSGNALPAVLAVVGGIAVIAVVSVIVIKKKKDKR